MSNVVQRIFRIQKGETALVLTLGFLLFCNSFALETADVISTSGFLSEVSVPNILLVWIVDMALVILTGAVASLVVDRYPRVRLMAIMSIAIAVIYVVLRLLFLTNIPDWFNYALLFLIGEQQWIFFPLIFWVLGNDIFSLSQAKRLFPLITGVGFIGQVSGVAVAASAPQLLESTEFTDIDLLTLNAIIYVGCFIVVALFLRKVDVRDTSSQKFDGVRKVLTEGWDFIKNVPAFKFLSLSLLGLAAVMTVIEFHFFVVAHDTYPGAEEFQAYYGLYRLILITASVIVTAFFSSRIIERAGLKNSFVISPVISLLVAIMMLVSPGVVVATVGVLVSKTLFSTIDQSSRRSFQSLVPEERRGRVSMFIESYVGSLGVMLGAIVIGITVLIDQYTDLDVEQYILYMALGIILSVLSTWGIFQLRKTYDSSLLNWRLKRRQRRSSVFDSLDFDI